MNGTIITNKGIALIAKLIASGSPLAFTRMAVGTGQISDGIDPAGLAGLMNYKVNGTIAAVETDGEVASLVCQISSDENVQGFTITEAGIFATDPDEGEILYAYLNLSDDPQYIYGEEAGVSKFLEIILSVVVGQVSNIDASISISSLVTREVMERELTKIEKRYAPIGYETINAGEEGGKRWAKIATLKCHYVHDEAGCTLLAAKQHRGCQSYLDEITLRLRHTGDPNKPEIELTLNSPRPSINRKNIQAVVTENTEQSIQLELYICLDEPHNAYNVSALNAYGDYVIHSKQEYVEILPGGIRIQAADASNKILWEGAERMGNNISITLSEPILQQKSGIILSWFHYKGGTDDVNYTFIPKSHIRLSDGAGVSCMLGYSIIDTIGCKHVLVSNNTISGHENNLISINKSGALIDNSQWLLRSVIGV